MTTHRRALKGTSENLHNDLLKHAAPADMLAHR